MREIKFRAWDRRNKKMYDFLPLIVRQNTIDPTYWEPLLKKAQEQFDVMQFTNKFDKHANEIYDGDILKTPSGGPNVIVSWNSNNARWRLDSVKPGTSFGVGRLHQFEIIGNIYENAELLKPNQDKD